MSDKINETIKDIAVKHGVVLGKDDPVLIFQTMNERLLEENRKVQQDMLAFFKGEMEAISSQWKNDAQEKAEKVLNVALASSKEAMARLLQESTRESVQSMKKMISDSLIEAHIMAQQTQKFSRFALLSSVALFATSCMLILLFYK
ncbi:MULTISPECIES: hypothetical protein [Legionella]|jgi:hypothetical protein|uniref:TraM protein n=1 Tax=Legionella shakespearei DSM 23087 TaxID=1122169 RepID=A0A0W0YKE1_9GAMM|nr:MULTISPECIES: hypothetical protein [Legionella]HAU3761204.1 conjugal transfer protein TraM [Legionella pneumophila]KTD57357.1 traM protein [Legionella shakespearei DSM 23087]MCW8451774.1 conjugal transfer protein TraM [Legionella quinlivanii]HBD7468618.1 conjugal transfer protein TraM [Legionella pneumophila]HCE5637932.1 conjugal transfer protein TraM [Legionella pneumophila]